MGKVRTGPPRELMKTLRNKFNIKNFVETGTFYGNTARWASGEFKHVKSIELDDELYNRVLQRDGHIQNIEYMHGKSQRQLPKALKKINTPAIFWLDAHYSGEGTAGENYECPLLEELEAIGNTEMEKYIFIDDARLFCTPPPRPHSAEDWPTISDVVLKMEEQLGDKYYIAIMEDVIVAVPPSAKNIVLNYAQDVSTKMSNRSKFEQGTSLIIQALFDIFNTESNRRFLKRTGLYPVARKLYHRFNVR